MNLKRSITLICLLFVVQFLSAQVRVPIGQKSTPSTSKVKLTLSHRYQRYDSKPKSTKDIYDRSINSPKSAFIINEKSKFYINSLEGFQTPVYDLNTFSKINVINHKFSAKNSNLFLETNFHDYKFRTKSKELNVFNGKPVEMCASHNNKYLWIPYYRRSYDRNAIDPSAVAIVDTDNDQIVRVMPTAPLPKMVACSADNKYIAVTNWGDNTVHIIDVSSSYVKDFKYIKHFTVERKLSLNYGSGHINRDSNCGFCLRGTIFTPDSKYLLVGRMGGGGIAFFDMSTMEYIGTVMGTKTNLRHIIISGEYLYISSNKTGYIQRTNLKDIVSFAVKNKNNQSNRYTQWKNVKSGLGARTIVATTDGKYIFATANSESKLTVIDAEQMTVIASIKVDSYPVGMEISNDNKMLVVTSQGKRGIGGFSVMIFDIEY